MHTEVGKFFGMTKQGAENALKKALRKVSRELFVRGLTADNMGAPELEEARERLNWKTARAELVPCQWHFDDEATAPPKDRLSRLGEMIARRLFGIEARRGLRWENKQ